MRLIKVKLRASFIKIDNPGGYWLKKQIELAKRKYPDVTSTDTAIIKRIMIPSKMLKNIAGLNNEHTRFNLQRNIDRIEKLKELIQEVGFDELGEITIIVRYNGTPVVYEGNHRIQAALQLGIKKIPCKIHYNAGSEIVKGKFHPDSLKKFINCGRT